MITQINEDDMIEVLGIPCETFVFSYPNSSQRQEIVKVLRKIKKNSSITMLNWSDYLNDISLLPRYYNLDGNIVLLGVNGAFLVVTDMFQDTFVGRYAEDYEDDEDYDEDDEDYDEDDDY